MHERPSSPQPQSSRSIGLPVSFSQMAVLFRCRQAVLERQRDTSNALREDVVVAGGGVVVGDDGRHVKGERPQVVDTAANLPHTREASFRSANCPRAIYFLDSAANTCPASSS
jgi:hypothetical protein